MKENNVMIACCLGSFLEPRQTSSRPQKSVPEALFEGVALAESPRHIDPFNLVVQAPNKSDNTWGDGKFVLGEPRNKQYGHRKSTCTTSIHVTIWADDETITCSSFGRAITSVLDQTFDTSHAWSAPRTIKSLREDGG